MLINLHIFKINISPYEKTIYWFHTLKKKNVPQFLPAQVWFALTQLKTNKSTVSGDIPAKLIKQFAAYLAEPFTDILNTSVRRGEYPEIYKF